ncbi:ATP-grasp fold amidoligase family protein [Lutimaribacter marinistellae]|uniref:ATP-grasp fold amidoligase family protein n=1 Tax=Lutimaribacter marinistellae TaxID=1820329 RepID=A0ABV7TBS1_9RHOB
MEQRERDKKRLLPPFSTWVSEGASLPEWLSRSHMARGKSAPQPPSFAVQMDSWVRRSRIQEKLLGTDSTPRLLRRRAWASDWLTSRGWKTPEILSGPFALQDIAQHLEGLESGVIKPVNATNAWGVLPFVRTGPFEFQNLFDGERYRMSEVLERLHNPMQRYMFPNKWQIETLIAPKGEPNRVPDDFKVYAFAGEIALILQVRRHTSGNRYKFYDSEWNPVDTGKYPDTTDNDLPLPEVPESLCEVASKISSALPVPFCRIDLFEGSEGLAVGELTPEPGRYQAFSDSADLYLGAFFEWALAVQSLQQSDT